MAQQQGYRNQSAAREQAEQDFRDAVERGRAQRLATGQSAPHSAAESSSGLSPQPQWNKAFPKSAMPLSAAYGPPNPAAMDAVRTGTNATLDPYDWRGKVGVATPPPINNNGFTDKGAVIPDQATNYLGESTHFDPYSNSRVIEVDPAKDMRFSAINPATGQSQTSGAQTAAGIQAKYQTPGTTASFTPGTVTDAGGNVTNNGQPVFNRQQSEADLQSRHPAIFQANTPENQAFVAHAQQYGEPSAHANADKIVQGVNSQAQYSNDQGKTWTPNPTSTQPQQTAQNTPKSPLSAY